MGRRTQRVFTPRLVTRTEAARYCGLPSPQAFDRTCPVQAINIGSGEQPIWRYDLNEVDEWINACKSGEVPSANVDWLERAGS